MKEVEPVENVQLLDRRAIWAILDQDDLPTFIKKVEAGEIDLSKPIIYGRNYDDHPGGGAHIAAIRANAPKILVGY